MDCKTARLLIELHRPWAPEVAPADLDDLRHHAADCPECAALQQTEERYDQALGQAIRAVPTSEGLRERILGRLNRQPWHQRPSVRWGLSAAAAVLLVGAGYAWWHQRVAVKLPIIAEAANARPRTAADVDAWFEGHGIAAQAPRGFNYRLLSSIGRADFQDRRVPAVDLVARDGAVARIYILDGGRFDLDTLDLQQHGSGRFTIQALPRETDPRFGYVIEFSGGSLIPFQEVGGPPPT